MRPDLVAGKYALALFNVALKRNELDAVAADLDSIDRLERLNPNFGRTLKSPTVSVEFKRGLLAAAIQNKVTATTYNTLNLLLDKHRIGLFPQMASEFRDLMLQHKGIIHAVAWTAVPLDLRQTERLKTALGRLSGKTIEVENRVDERVLGGMVVGFGEKILDGSVRRGLDDLRDTLMKVRVL